MTKSQKTRARIAALLLGGAALLVPVSLSPGEVVETNDACAGDVCCREAGTSCFVDGEYLMNHYSSSSCKPL